MAESCSNCKYGRGQLAPDKTLVTTCQRYPPTVVAIMQPDGIGNIVPVPAMLPIVCQPNQWCGEWAPKKSILE